MASPTEANLPFGMGDIDFSDPVSAAMAVVALIFGFVVFHMSNDVGAQLSTRVNSFIASATGAEVGDASNNDPVVI
jgi:hypothetical protein